MKNSRIEKVLSEHDLTAYVSEFVQLKQFGKNLKARCVFHEERTASFYVYPEKQRWKCFGCQRGGNIINFVQEKFHCDTRAALDILEKKPIDSRRHISLPSKTAPSKQFLKAVAELEPFRWDVAVLLGLLEHPRTRTKTMRVICDTGNLWLHSLAVTIPVNKHLWKWSDEVRSIKEQCRARDVIGLKEINEGL